MQTGGFTSAVTLPPSDQMPGLFVSDCPRLFLYSAFEHLRKRQPFTHISPLNCQPLTKIKACDITSLPLMYEALYIHLLDNSAFITRQLPRHSFCSRFESIINRITSVSCLETTNQIKGLLMKQCMWCLFISAPTIWDSRDPDQQNHSKTAACKHRPLLADVQRCKSEKRILS